MKEIWTLIIKTQLTPAVRAFYSFSEAKDALREALKKLTFKKNEMFDGEGKITRLKQYIDKTVDFKRESDDGILTKEVLNKVQNALCDVFAGKETMADIEEGIYTDYFKAHLFNRSYNHTCVTYDISACFFNNLSVAHPISCCLDTN